MAADPFGTDSLEESSDLSAQAASSRFNVSDVKRHNFQRCIDETKKSLYIQSVLQITTKMPPCPDGTTGAKRESIKGN
jgi:hypothetical protein